jgi:hypothetical protein
MEIQEIQVQNDLAVIYAHIDDTGLCTATVDITDIPAWLPLNQMSLIEQIPIMEKYANLEKLEWNLIEDKVQEPESPTLCTMQP